MRSLRSILGCVLLAGLLAGFGLPASAQRKVLFDAAHRENAGNADWIIDADSHDLNQPHYPCGGSDFENESRARRFPTPDQSTVDGSTLESYWTGGISAFAIDLVQLGFEVESLPEGVAITFGDGGNPQDLGNYDVFVLPEPNAPYDVAETLAIRDFVAAGGGLLLITDHQTSDRDCDGFDSPHIGNDLMGVTISSGVITDFGLFGIVFNVSEIAAQTSTDYWFDDAVDSNVSTDPTDPIINGPHGSGAGGLGFFGATAMTIDTATNPTVRGHVWKTDAGGQGSTRVTFATASYMSGRIACIGDSSPADDNSGDPGDSLHPGWDLASGGVNNREIHLNAVEWLAGPDTTAPLITSGPTATPTDCSAVVSWGTDEPSDSLVNYGATAAYGSSESDATLATQHAVVLSGLLPAATYHFQVESSDGASNGPTQSTDSTFMTQAAASPLIVAGPTVVALSGSSATIAWQTDEPTDARVYYGTTASYGSDVYDAGPSMSHAIVLTGLTPTTMYHFQVESDDGCGTASVFSSDQTFTTSAAQIDLSNWTLQQFNSSQSFAFPPGTFLPSGGFLVLGRDASQTSFESEWGALPVGTIYVDSGGVFPFINGGESFELLDAGSGSVDGVTISMSSGTTIQRNNPGDPAAAPGSWTVAGSAAGSPGSGVGLTSGVGVVINEASDASNFNNEFVELYYDAAPAGPDTTSPADVVDLTAEPLSDSAVRLSWTAPGDDALSGQATAYDLRYSGAPLLTDAAFAQATVVVGLPMPGAASTSESFDVTGLSDTTSYYFALKTVDELPNESGLSNSPGATTAAPGGGGGDPVAEHVVIGEIQLRGTVDHDDEFIELYNPTEAPVDLTGWSLQYKSASGTSFSRFDLPAASIAAGGYYLVTRPPADYTGSVPGDTTQSVFLMSASGGHLFLVPFATNLTSCTDSQIVDKIGYGSGDCPEAAASATHAAGQSLERAPGATAPLCGNGTDSDDNSADFDLLTLPDPQNSATSEPPCRELGEVGSSLFLGVSGRDDLVWAAALGAVDYKIRRASTADYLLNNPPPDDTDLLTQTATPGHTDSDVPAPGALFFYFVNATDGAGDESDN